jgi:glyoxylase-like metal-dependent hydrolase (beta-lactamase superfamily II)/ferredoxin
MMTFWRLTMANAAKRLATNIEGNFFVDSTCINCDTCRQLAPSTFSEQDDYSFVAHQPENQEHALQAYQALLACPVGSIGALTGDKGLLDAATASFPIHIDGPVYYNGFNSEKSFGANSYFIRRPEGNWLIDSPRYMRRLVQAFEQWGGIHSIFLTHEDDVADADRYAKRFGARRIIHRADMAAQPDAEMVIDGTAPLQAAEGCLILPVPGHTEGSQALLYADRYLFAGDHLWWVRDENRLGMPSVLVWSEKDLYRSTRRLLDHAFEWVLPGHGDRIHLPSAHMKQELHRLLVARTNQET